MTNLFIETEMEVDDARQISLTSPFKTNSNMSTPWKPYEDESPYSLHHLRHKVLPPAISKRHFFLPQVNRIGVTIPETVITVIIAVLVGVLAYSQRTNDADDSGSVAQLLWIPLFLFITYRSIITWIFGISFERSMYWHGFLAFIATFYSIWHGLCAIYWAVDDGDDDDRVTVRRGLEVFNQGSEDRDLYITGSLSALFMILLVVSSIHPIRRYFRRFWLWSHHILPIPAAVFAILHGAPTVLIGFVIYLVDRLYGYLYQSFVLYKSMGSHAQVSLLPSGLVKISFPNALKFIPGQFICLRIPSVSIFEYHTFTIASIPCDDKIVVLVKPDGVWSRKLAKHIEQSPNDDVAVKMVMHGPVGSVALEWQSNRYQSFIIFAGGIGITPMLSIYRHLANQARRGRQLKVVYLIWCMRNKQIVEDVVQSQMQAGSLTIEDGLEGSDDNGFTCKLFLSKGDERYAVSDEERIVLGNVQWNVGRPKVGELFDDFTRRHSDHDRVAVLGCGPGSLTADVCKQASRASGNGIVFDVHLEHFY